MLLLTLSSCSEPKLRLRAPEAKITEKPVINDSLKIDSMDLGKIKSAD